MSMLATAMPSPHPAFGREYPWEGSRCSDYSNRARVDSDRVALPSIRQAFPELHLRLQPQDAAARLGQTNNMPPVAPALGTSASPEYVHSPNFAKRRRLSFEEEHDHHRARQVPRLYRSPQRTPAQQMSPNIPPRPTVSENWPNSARTSPFLTNGPMPVPAPVEIKDRATDVRAALPSLPPPHTLKREPAPLPPMQAPLEAPPVSRAPIPFSGNPVMDPPPATYRETSYNYPYHHPNRYQSLSTGHHFDRTHFASSAYGSPYPDYMRYGDVGGLSGDNKQRKRRGNLPKETTDKLRAWFMAHLQHPYPTEDEKQDLMRQTGLQMNQISNWFINARRRQLPTMISNARAESEAMNGTRSTDAKVLATTERDFDPRKREMAGPLSDSEGGTYDEDLETLNQRRVVNMNRGSV